MARRAWGLIPATTRVQLGEGDWVDFKNALTIGEENEAFGTIAGKVNEDGSRTPNYKVIGAAELFANIVAWNLVDAQEQQLPLSLDSILNMPRDQVKVLSASLKEHQQNMEAKMVASKKTDGGETASASTSPSAVS